MLNDPMGFTPHYLSWKPCGPGSPLSFWENGWILELVQLLQSMFTGVFICLQSLGAFQWLLLSIIFSALPYFSCPMGPWWLSVRSFVTVPCVSLRVWSFVVCFCYSDWVISKISLYIQRHFFSLHAAVEHWESTSIDFLKSVIAFLLPKFLGGFSWYLL